ncbi:LysR family transcriptional regulator [Suttonella ornithocola]|uniref:D-malate degradation protein R n=1 Tax=Suttonella ornithocola TaxID=279832 RepID=A0A380MMW6_9GAMM|nr:LysR family transcriptional regulator [Suttonella ornithocola]SUO93960.1 D-malate degradation protein R [Suttonella ornithocola]
MDKLSALRYFCMACETLNFREAAQRLAVSPQVVTRNIAELEAQLEERLFKRNTRSIQLTDFGKQFLPKASQLLADCDRLFASTKINRHVMQGIVRITVPPLPCSQIILCQLLQALEPYPDLVIDWRVSLEKFKPVDDQIDIGIRICLEPEPDWIAHYICNIEEKIVASPKLIERLGMPKDLCDLAQNYPLSGIINPKLKRVWHWQINNKIHIQQHHVNFISLDMVSGLQAALSGRICAYLPDVFCQDYIKNGELIELFAEIEKQQWQCYLYRPYQSNSSQRIVLVFNLLKNLLKEHYKLLPEK